MRRASRVVAVLAFAALYGCGAAQVKRSDATLAVTCADAEAALYVDDAATGRAAATREHPVGLAAGFHRVEVRSDGKLAAYREVTLPRGEHATITVELRPDLDQTAP